MSILRISTVMLTGALLMSLTASKMKTPTVASDCDGCEYELKFKKTINTGDDEVYELYCKKKGRTYDVYKRKAGHWERGDSGQKLTLCQTVKYYCDCSE